MKTEKHIIQTYHGENFLIELEVSKKQFEAELKKNTTWATEAGLKPDGEPSESNGEYYDMKFEAFDKCYKKTVIFGCATSETRFIKYEAKEGFGWK